MRTKYYDFYGDKTLPLFFFEVTGHNFLGLFIILFYKNISLSGVWIHHHFFPFLTNNFCGFLFCLLDEKVLQERDFSSLEELVDRSCEAKQNLNDRAPLPHKVYPFTLNSQIMRSVKANLNLKYKFMIHITVTCRHSMIFK